jgi:hypothetical protein
MRSCRDAVLSCLFRMLGACLRPPLTENRSLRARRVGIISGALPSRRSLEVVSLGRLVRCRRVRVGVSSGRGWRMVCSNKRRISLAVAPEQTERNGAHLAVGGIELVVLDDVVEEVATELRWYSPFACAHVQRKSVIKNVATNRTASSVKATLPSSLSHRPTCSKVHRPSGLADCYH